MVVEEDADITTAETDEMAGVVMEKEVAAVAVAEDDLGAVDVAVVVDADKATGAVVAVAVEAVAAAEVVAAATQTDHTTPGMASIFKKSLGLSAMLTG